MNTLFLRAYANLRAIYKLAPHFEARLKLLNYVEQWIVPSGLGKRDTSSFLPTDYIGCAGIDMHTSEQIERLKRWKKEYSDIFAALKSESLINTWKGDSYLDNGYYPTPDAEIYAAMILDTQPRSIIEIGGGFSTIIARAAVNKLNNRCRIVVIDPEPRTDISDFADEVIRARIEDIKLDACPVQEQTLLFIDSTHITRAGGDIPFIYNCVLPNAPVGTTVHVHDICIPYDYPAIYQEWLYTEQYVLHALLSHTTRYRVLLAAHYMTRQHPEIMRDVFSPIVGKRDRNSGFAFWFRVQEA